MVGASALALALAFRGGGGGDPALRCASSNIFIINNRLQDPRPFFAQPILKAKRMAEKAETETETETETRKGDASKLEEEKKDKEREKKADEEIPPPPEKPLPDDCCGSGCVRCVWDVYYEELEEYNKLYKQDPNPKS